MSCALESEPGTEEKTVKSLEIHQGLRQSAAMTVDDRLEEGAEWPRHNGAW